MDRHGDTHTTHTQEAEHFHELLKDFDTAMLVTHTEGGGLHARPMAIAEVAHEGGEIWFATSIDSRKTEELRLNPKVLVLLMGATKYLSIDGKAEIVRDPAKARELWKESWRVWFDDKNDPEIALLRIDTSEAEYWDNSGLRGFKFLAKAAAAYVKGEKIQEDGDTPDPKHHGKVQV